MARIETYTGEKLAHMLQELGYEDVTIVLYQFAYGASAKREEDRESSAQLWAFGRSNGLFVLFLGFPLCCAFTNSILIQRMAFLGLPRCPMDIMPSWIA